MLCNKQPTLKKILGYFLNPNVGLSLLGHLFWLFFQCLGSLCTFYFIYKIVSVQYIVQMYAEQHTGAGCESLNKRRSCRFYCLMKSLMLCLK